MVIRAANESLKRTKAAGRAWARLRAANRSSVGRATATPFPPQPGRFLAQPGKVPASTWEGSCFGVTAGREKVGFRRVRCN